MKHLSNLGFTHFMFNEIIKNYHFIFWKQNDLFANTNSQLKESLPPFLDENLDAIKAINLFCKNLISVLVAKKVCSCIYENALVTLLETRKKESSDNNLIELGILNQHGSKFLYVSTTVKQMSMLGCKCKTCTKLHYAGNCKKEETILHHFTTVKRHLKRELRCFRLTWMTDLE